MSRADRKREQHGELLGAGVGMRLAKAGLFRVIKSDLAVLEENLREAAASSVPLIHEVGTHLVASGGKRLRPALFLLAARSGPAFDRVRAMPLAVAVELIHMASLVHDDVIDGAGTRRGEPTANARWGNQVAILCGDYLFAQAFSSIAGQHYGEAIGIRLAELVRELASGEILQDAALFQAEHSLPDYYQRIEKKTANFLALCCEMGAIVSGAAGEVAKGLYLYGHAVGMAFQITDDLLDITGDAAKLGKPAGNDIRQGVVTLPVIRALEVSPEREELASILTNRQMTEPMVARALAIVRATDGPAFAQRQADEQLQRAKEALPAYIPSAVRETFTAAADYIGRRDF